MSFLETLQTLAHDPEQMEATYRNALDSGDSEAFKSAVEDAYASNPDSLLLAAWHFRLAKTVRQAKEHFVAWGWAIPLAVLNGLLFWWLSADGYQIPMTRFDGVEYGFMPLVVALGVPIAALCVIAYLCGVGDRRWPRALVCGLVPFAIAAYGLLLYQQAGPRPYQEQYLGLFAAHLALLGWAAVGVYLLWDHGDAENRLAFIKKSIELLVMGGIFGAAGGVFIAITMALFQALDVTVPETIQRLLIAGGAGLVPVLVAAIAYNPNSAPREQSLAQGLSKLIGLLLRILLPMTLLVLAIYVAFIPFNFSAPFQDRDMLVTSNIMLFAVVALLVGATPVGQESVSPRLERWLRRGVIAVAALALVVSLYALAAIAYRTAIDRLTPNRLAFIGWNVINIGLLGLVLWYQRNAGNGRWRQALYRAIRAASLAYVAWALISILVTPWAFGVGQLSAERLPESVQRIVYDYPAPILLKCTGSPHVYLLKGGEKRWIEDIEIFSARGFRWHDVRTIDCEDLRSIPSGEPIPADAGTPPQP